MSKPQSLESARVMDDVGLRCLKTAEEIRKRGWCQRVTEDAEGRVCLLGGAMKACRDQFQAYEVVQRVSQYLGGERIMNAVRWNNAPGRSAAEVISALTSAAFQDGEGK